MSASFGAPGLNGGEQGYMGHNMLDRNFQNPAMAYGPPPGLAFRNNVAPSPAMSSVHGGSGLDSAHGEFLAFHPQGREFVRNTERRSLPARKHYFRS
jgi:hypothetical protein